ncbi:MAG: succinate dehydrogenase, hydrophobic membrane anchor protein [Alphaproteobacteria bacterium]
MSLKTPLGRVRGLGSAKDGTEHFWIQRVTAIALVPLVIWFIAKVIALTGADYMTARAAVADPLFAVPLLLLIGTGFYHLKLGMQVVIEDYVSNDALKIPALLLNTFFCAGVGILSAFAVLQISFGG